MNILGVILMSIMAIVSCVLAIDAGLVAAARQQPSNERLAAGFAASAFCFLAGAFGTLTWLNW